MSSTRARTTAETQRREAAAYHEAGHTVAAFAYKKQIHRVSIKADHDEGRLPYQESAPVIGKGMEYGERDRYLRVVTERVAMCLAGIVAEQERVQGGGKSTSGRRDRRDAAELASRIVPEDELQAYMKWLMVRTRTLIRARWPAVEALAQELLLREELGTGAVTKLLRAEQ